MLQNAYFLAKIGADTAENEQHFAEIAVVLMLSYSPLTVRPGPLSAAPGASTVDPVGCASGAAAPRVAALAGLRKDVSIR